MQTKHHLGDMDRDVALRNWISHTARSLSTALSDGLPSLQLDAQKALDTQRRTGKLVDPSPQGMEVIFGFPTKQVDYVLTEARIGDTIWRIID